MTVLSAVQLAAPYIGLDVPDQVYSATTREMVEMQGIANEAAKQITDEHEWEDLKAIATITGDGSTTDFDLPSDFDRMVKDAELRSSVNTLVPVNHVISVDEWLALETQGIDFPYGRWIRYGGQIHIKPARSSSVTVKYFYLKNTRIAPASGSNKAEFTADDDSFVLSERLLKLAIIWLWKAQKGTDYQEDLVNYQIALAKEVSADRGPASFAVGGNTGRKMSVSTAYPYPLGS